MLSALGLGGGHSSSRMPPEHARRPVLEMHSTSSAAHNEHELSAVVVAEDLEPASSTTASSTSGMAAAPAVEAPQPSRDDVEQPTPRPDLSECTECIICLQEMGEEGTTTLDCEHRFHEECVTEWLDKDGRCPVCRHQVRPVNTARLDNNERMTMNMAGLRSLAGVAFLVLESRRLMMLATVEAALAILVMSYVADLISPGMMILAAVVTFFGAAHYLPKTVYASIPLLFCNALYHVFLMTQIVHQQQGAAFFLGGLRCGAHRPALHWLCDLYGAGHTQEGLRIQRPVACHARRRASCAPHAAAHAHGVGPTGHHRHHVHLDLRTPRRALRLRCRPGRGNNLQALVIRLAVRFDASPLPGKLPEDAPSPALRCLISSCRAVCMLMAASEHR
mmetsp:Transcript_44396/g.88740  ORF Transcript_44396/g.88740 Transcript_44396/m.88740 type:complete len:391 (-) Transcript_44396:459-1631(-)